MSLGQVVCRPALLHQESWCDLAAGAGPGAPRSASTFISFSSPKPKSGRFTTHRSMGQLPNATELCWHLLGGEWVTFPSIFPWEGRVKMGLIGRRGVAWAVQSRRWGWRGWDEILHEVGRQSTHSFYPLSQLSQCNWHMVCHSSHYHQIHLA